MKPTVWPTLFLLACFSVFTWGCESVALMPRPDIDRSNIDRSEIERNRDVRDRSLARDEIVGTVQRVDEGRGEIQRRTTEA
jgi:hypothetical protein